MSKSDLKNVAKWLWVVAVFSFLIYHVVNKKDLISQMLDLLSIKSIVVASMLVFVAKLSLVANMRTSAWRFNINLDWRDCYCIYNLTQLAKYIPGSIWQFVGRIAILKSRGVPMSDIRDSLVVEHMWVVSSAAIIGLILILINRPDFISDWLYEHGFEESLDWFPLVIALFVVGIVLALKYFKYFKKWMILLIPPVQAVLVLVITWFSLGASLWVILGPFSEVQPTLMYVVGIFGFAYVVGFLVPFAPAGFGIREAVLAFGLLPFMGMSEAILLAAINRIIYFIVEIGVASFCMIKTKQNNKYA